ncbi:uncharacterized protein [Onthophagus taurus]|uniref:uncharacterized protein n=1 Tax=Onthophagus taurus TaxID=166361 RepID=UPI0039BDBA2E
MVNKNYFTVIFSMVLTTGNTLRCSNPDPIKTFSEKTCVENGRKWFQIGGSKPCENCCIYRNMTQISDRHLAITDTVIKDDETQVFNYNVVRDENASIYYSESISEGIIMLDTDCNKYAIIYDSNTNDLQVFSKLRNLNATFVNTLDGIKQCNLPIYDYGTEEACQKII